MSDKKKLTHPSNTTQGTQKSSSAANNKQSNLSIKKKTPTNKKGKEPFISQKLEKILLIHKVIKTFLLSILFVFYSYHLIEYIIKEVSKKTIIVDEFIVPEEQEKNGNTGKAVARELIDNFFKIQKIVEQGDGNQEISMEHIKKYMKPTTIIEHSDFLKDMDIGPKEFSLKEFILLHLREIFGYQISRISGEVVQQDSFVTITARISQSPPKIIKGEIAEFDTLLFNTALSLYTEINPDFNPYFLSMYYLSMNRQKECESVLYQILNNNQIEDDVLAYIGLGKLFYTQGDPEGALESFHEALGLDSTLTVAYIKIAQTHHKLNNAEKAQQFLTKASKIDSSNARLFYTWGVILQEGQEYKLAIEKYKRAIHLKPSFKDTYYNLGLSYYECGEFHKAKQCLKKFLWYEQDGKYAKAARDLLKKLNSYH